MSTTFANSRSKHRTSALMLYAAFAVPLIYYGTLLLASAVYPGYSHVTQYASELGSASATYPALFNAGIVLAGVCAILGGIGVYRALRALSGGTILAALLASTIVLHGVGFVFGGLYPMPDERHGGYGTGIAVVAGPLLAALAMRCSPPEQRWVRWLLAVNAVAVVVMFAIMMGVGGLVTRGNVGLFQRVATLIPAAHQRSRTMATKKTGLDAAKAASRVLHSKSSGKSAKSAAGSALTQKDSEAEKTSPRAASAASKVLREGTTSRDEKSAAGSALSQRSGNSRRKP